MNFFMFEVVVFFEWTLRFGFSLLVMWLCNERGIKRWSERRRRNIVERERERERDWGWYYF